jgi:protein AATF/BFR2
MALKKKTASAKRARSAGSEGRDVLGSGGGGGGGGSRPPPSNNTASDGLFSAIRALDAEDSREDAKRRRRGHRLVEQSRAAQSQAALYWSLVECRIVLQRSVAGLHKWRLLQQQQQQQETGIDSQGAPDAADQSSEFVEQCDELLVRLLEGRRTLTRKQTGGIDTQQHRDKEQDKVAISYASVVAANRDADEPTEPLENVLQSEYDEIRSDWRDVLNKRHSDVRLRSGLTSKTQFKVVDSSFWHQVEATAEHEHQHHQLRANAAARSTSSSSDKESRPTFDDSKVYQQLLKDFLSSHHGASGAASGSSDAQERLLRRRREKEQQSSSRAAVDRKASKGRKIRYHDIPKLQHFTFPIARGAGGGNGGGGGSSAHPAATTLLDEDEWFRSLFGGGVDRT